MADGRLIELTKFIEPLSSLGGGGPKPVKFDALWVNPAHIRMMFIRKSGSEAATALDLSGDVRVTVQETPLEINGLIAALSKAEGK